MTELVLGPCFKCGGKCVPRWEEGPAFGEGWGFTPPSCKPRGLYARCFRCGYEVLTSSLDEIEIEASDLTP
jgi:hypothetical protein